MMIILAILLILVALFIWFVLGSPNDGGAMPLGGLFRIIAAVVAGFAVLLLVIHFARAAPPEGADQRLAPWFNSLRQPGTGVSCCSIADCRPVDYRFTSKGYEVFVGEQWRPVPQEKILQGYDNPTGRAVVCWTPALGVLCFVRDFET